MKPRVHDEFLFEYSAAAVLSLTWPDLRHGCLTDTSCSASVAGWWRRWLGGGGGGRAGGNYRSKCGIARTHRGGGGKQHPPSSRPKAALQLASRLAEALPCTRWLMCQCGRHASATLHAHAGLVWRMSGCLQLRRRLSIIDHT